MLVLSRRVNQSIFVGDNTKIQILKISGNTIRIGIEAPSDAKILHGEITPDDVDVKTPKSETFAIEFEMDQDDRTLLPNPFAVARAS